MMESKNKNTVDTDELDSLLDDALQDFNKPATPKVSQPLEQKSEADPNAWTEEFISAATQNFEATMNGLISQQKDDNEKDPKESAEFDVSALTADFNKLAEAAANAATNASGTTEQDFSKCLAETLEEIAKNQQEAQTMPSADDLGKMFENLGLGGGGGGVSGDESSSEELGGLFPMMQTLLENVLSKDVLYPPFKEIVGKYPDWLADNHFKLPTDDFDRYSKQYDIMKKVVECFEEEEETDADTKSKSSEAILILMQQLQDLGQPPQDLVGDQIPAFPLGLQGATQLPDISTFLKGVGFPTPGAEGHTAPPPSGEGAPGGECALM